MTNSTLTIIFITILLGGCGYYGIPIEGKVYDVDTGRPLEGAIVVAMWHGYSPVPAETVEICYHVLSTTSDKDGKYRFDFWWQWEGAGNEAAGKSVDLHTYMKGYDLARQSKNFQREYHNNNFPMGKFKGDTKKWVEILDYFSSLSCDEAGKSYKNLYRLRRTVYDDSLSVAQPEISDIFARWAVFSLLQSSQQYAGTPPLSYPKELVIKVLGENP